MKKSFLITVGAIVGLGLLASCALQQSPVSPSTSLVGQSNSKNMEMPVPATNLNPTTPGTSDPVKFSFLINGAKGEMNASTINGSTVKVYYKTSDTAETQFTTVSVSYNAVLKEGSLTPTSAWLDNTRYRVLFTTGIQSATGVALDGNGNGIAESAEFDNANRTFNVGTPVTTAAYITKALEISSINVVHEGGSWDLSTGNVNSVPVTYGYVTITVNFDAIVDISRLVTGATLHSNASITNATTGVPVTPVSVEGYDNSVTAVFDFTANTRYKLQLMGGVNGARSSTAGTEAVLTGRLFGGEDSSTIAEAADKAVRYITTGFANGDSTAPPTVSSVSYSGGSNRYWTVNFTVPTVSGDMDRATLVSSNFQLEATYSSTTYNVAIKAFEILDDDSVRIYVPDSFYPASGTSHPSVTMLVIVKRNVMSEEGIKLDGDVDGIGGTATDDYRSGTASVESRDL